MKLGELIRRLNEIRDEIADRNPDEVEVVLMNPNAKSMCKIVNRRFSVAAVSFEFYPEPVDSDRSVWVKQVRIQRDDHE